MSKSVCVCVSESMMGGGRDGRIGHKMMCRKATNKHTRSFGLQKGCIRNSL